MCALSLPLCIKLLTASIEINEAEARARDEGIILH